MSCGHEDCRCGHDATVEDMSGRRSTTDLPQAGAGVEGGCCGGGGHHGRHDAAERRAAH